jgi:hypothetical protein
MSELREWNEDYCDRCGNSYVLDIFHFDCEAAELVTTWRDCATWVYGHLMMSRYEQWCDDHASVGAIV